MIVRKIISCFWLFLIGSFVGFIMETIWCLLRNKRFEWRKSLIYEPIIPIYGLSGLIILLVCNYLKVNTTFQIFLVGFVISTIIEYIASFLQEKLFGTISWDYSEFPLNLGGRVNFLYSVLFGLAATVFYKSILLPINEYLLSVNITNTVITLFVISFIFFITDVIISAIAAFRMKERGNNIKRTSYFWHLIDNKYNDDYLKKIYPNAIVLYK